LVLAVVVVRVVAVTGAKAGKERDWDRDSRQKRATSAGRVLDRGVRRQSYVLDRNGQHLTDVTD